MSAAVKATSLADLLEALVDAMLATGAKQKELAARAGFTEKHVSQMFTGKVDGSLDVWQRLIDAAGLTVTFVIAEKPAS